MADSATAERCHHGMNHRNLTVVLRHETRRCDESLYQEQNDEGFLTGEPINVMVTT
jgi:hypothetical protein